MIDKCSSTKRATCASPSATSSTMRAVKNAIASYVGASYYNPHKTIVKLIGDCLVELGFTNVTVVNSNYYYNHLILGDYGPDVLWSIWNNGQSTQQMRMLQPRHIVPALSIGGVFNSKESCRATIRMLGRGPGQIRTALLLGSTSAPVLGGSTPALYFTEAKFMPTGDKYKCVVMVHGTSYHFVPYTSDWHYAPGYASDLSTVQALGSYCNVLHSKNNSDHEPFAAKFLFQDGKGYPRIPVCSHDDLWEFPDIIEIPYGLITPTSSSTYYAQPTGGTIYQIGDGKFWCHNVGTTYYMFRVE